MTREEEIEAAWRIHNGAGSPTPQCRVSTTLRHRLAEAQNWRCCYCGVPMIHDRCSPTQATIEHIVPRSLGGPNRPDNYVVACRACNEARGNAIEAIHIEAVMAWEAAA